MPTSVRVGDYYDNDDNGIWSWYLKNIRSGDFEELNTNDLKYTLLKRFLNSNIYGNNGNKELLHKNQKILLISIPDKIHSDISILETFLKDYFHLADLQTIKIQKLTQDHCYNHENHYLLMDPINNFNDPAFLNYVDPKRYNKFKTANAKNGNINTQNSQINQTNNNNNIHNSNTHIKDDGEDSLIDQSPTNANKDTKLFSESNPSLLISTINSNSLLDKSPQGESSNSSVTNPHTSNNLTSSSILSDDAASSIVLNFPRAPSHHIRHTQHEMNVNSRRAGKRDSVDSLLHSVFNNNNNPNGNGHSFTPPGSELVSINSYNYDDTSSYMEDDDEDHVGSKHPLTRMITPDEQEEEEIDDDDDGNGLNVSDIIPNGISKPSYPHNDLESFVSSVSSNSYSTYSSTSSTSSTSSYYSVLPSISINDECGHFRLVLQSALLYNEQKEIFTAIRQSNNVVTRASVRDDWILYDSEFSMNNLMMLTLKELFEFGQDVPKILFYSMVIADPPAIPKSDVIDNEIDVNNVANKLHEQLDIKDVDDMNLYDCDSYDDDDDASYDGGLNSIINDNDNNDNNPEMLYDEHEDEPQMYIPERMISNVTTAGHRSIRTVNSIGEWAYRKKSNVTSIGGGQGEEEDGNDKKDNNDDDDDQEEDMNNGKSGNSIDFEKDMNVTDESNRRHGNNLINIERWKSLPNHDQHHTDPRVNGDDSTFNVINSMKNNGNSSNHKSKISKNKHYNDGTIHSGGERWKVKMSKFKKSSDKKKYDDKFCTIM